MITVNTLKDFYETKQIYDKYNITFEPNCFCMAAKDGEEILGICLFKYEQDSVIIKEIMPRNDIMMADGVLRSTFFVASNKGIEKAFFDNESLEEIFTKLDFILDKNQKELKLKKIFDSCCGCSSENK